MGVNGGVYDFPMLEIGDIFGINTDLRIDPNSIPYPDLEMNFLKYPLHYRPPAWLLRLPESSRGKPTWTHGRSLDTHSFFNYYRFTSCKNG